MIVFCTTCKGRAKYLELTLFQNIFDNADYPNCKFVVLDYADDFGLRTYLWKNHRADIASGKLVVYSYFGEGIADPIPLLASRTPPPNMPFHMAHAKNMTARCGILEGADILVTQDADNFTGAGFAKYVNETLAPNSILCPDFKLIHSIPHGPDRPARGYAGRLAIRAQDFVKMGGYDEIYDTWRGEDMDILFRLERLGYKRQCIDNRFLDAVRHNSEVRFKEYPHAQEFETDDYLAVIAARTDRVVNNGKFGLGTVYRNFNPNPIKLTRLPSRIFGIGMHRTGTTSLDRAFQILGFDSFHFGNGNDSRLIWDEMNLSGTSKTLEKWYALSDIPIPLLFKKLDIGYPGSKFILTVRNENKWLKSVERLWSYEHNPMRKDWDTFPFSNRIHKALYGREDFEPNVFLERYRRHNTEVREYFKYRPNDLLIMDIDMGTGWDDICQFLGKKIPSVPYPHESHMKRMV